MRRASARPTLRVIDVSCTVIDFHCYEQQGQGQEDGVMCVGLLVCVRSTRASYLVFLPGRTKPPNYPILSRSRTSRAANSPRHPLPVLTLVCARTNDRPRLPAPPCPSVHRCPEAHCRHTGAHHHHTVVLYCGLWPLRAILYVSAAGIISIFLILTRRNSL